MSLLDFFHRLSPQQQAMEYMSDNNKSIAMAQVQAQEFALQQTSMDREMQLAANLELGIENLDTKLQMARMQFTEESTAEEDRHIEKMAKLQVVQEGREARHAQPSDLLPEPTSFLTDAAATVTLCEASEGLSHSQNDQWPRNLG